MPYVRVAGTWLTLYLAFVPAYHNSHVRGDYLPILIENRQALALWLKPPPRAPGHDLDVDSEDQEDGKVWGRLAVKLRRSLGMEAGVYMNLVCCSPTATCDVCASSWCACEVRQSDSQSCRVHSGSTDRHLYTEPE